MVRQAVWAVLLVACGGAARPAAEATAGAGAPETPVADEPPLLTLPSPVWTADPAYADVDLPFVMGITQRPCDAVYTVGLHDRIEVSFTYAPRAVRVSVWPGEQWGEGHELCLPSPPWLAQLELSPLTWTWELDEAGRVVGRTVDDGGGGVSRTRYLGEGDRWVGTAHDDGPVEPVRWQGGSVVSAPAPDGATVAFQYDGEGRLVDRRVEGADGSLAIAGYVYAEHAPAISSFSWSHYADPDGDEDRARGVSWEVDARGRPIRCAIGEGAEVRYEYDARGRLLQRFAVRVSEVEGETLDAPLWGWSYRYDCAEPRPSDDATY